MIEGFRELSRALRANVPLEYAVVSQSAAAKWSIADTFQKYLTLIVADEMFSKISQRDNPDGILGVAKTWECDLSRVKLQPQGLYLLVERLEKPGNLGALMRSAEATAVDGFFIADPIVDIFNPNVIRTSQGAVFNLNIYWGPAKILLDLFQKNTLNIFATTPHTQHNYWDCDLKHGCVICVGNEARGLDELWMNAAQKMLIPMYGSSADSLNASVSGTLCLYEARRQRRT